MTSVIITAGSDWTRPLVEEIEAASQWWAINETWWPFWRGHGMKPDLIVAMDDMRRDETVHPNYVDHIVSLGVPIIGPEPVDKWPQLDAYPLRGVLDFIGLSDGWRVLDNSVNYAMVLAMMRGHNPIILRGTDFVRPYEDQDLECAKVRWKYRGYAHAPDWFKYYEEWTVMRRGPCEPGQEGTHFLLGFAHAKGITVNLASTSTILNSDREKFFYGYQEQPDV